MILLNVREHLGLCCRADDPCSSTGVILLHVFLPGICLFFIFEKMKSDFWSLVHVVVWSIFIPDHYLYYSLIASMNWHPHSFMSHSISPRSSCRWEVPNVVKSSSTKRSKIESDFHPMSTATASSGSSTSPVQSATRLM